MFEKDILIYSDYCQHCTNFLSAITKHDSLFRDIIKLNIDVDTKTRTRPQAFYDIQQALQFSISEVPTVIVQKGQYVLVGEEAFKWLEHQIGQLADSETICVGFNPNEMGSFSDSYAPLSATELYDATEQSYKFLGKPDNKIHTPPEDSTISQNDYSKKQKERETMSTTKRSAPPIDFTSRDFTNSSSQKYSNGPSGASKQKEIDARLKELIMERDEQFNPPPQPKQVDFTI